jgi:hypothetical protein
MWKDDDGSNFDRRALEKFFPAKRGEAQRSERISIWKAMQKANHGWPKGYVGFEDFYKWFNEHTLKAERAPGNEYLEGTNSTSVQCEQYSPRVRIGNEYLKGASIWKYAQYKSFVPNHHSCLIRAFELANGHAEKRPGVSRMIATWSELRLLLLATQLVLVISRIFDIADTSGDKRVGVHELVAVLVSMGYSQEELGMKVNGMAIHLARPPDTGPPARVRLTPGPPDTAAA